MARVLAVGRSALFCAALLFVFLGIPGLVNAERLRGFFGGAADAVSSASLAVPDRPSGEFVILMNREKHIGTVGQWTDFFLERDAQIIFEDLHALVIGADAPGVQLAERYQARLAEHQMTVRREDALLTASRAQAGVFDIIIVSKEAAEAVHLETAEALPQTVRLVVADAGETTP